MAKGGGSTRKVSANNASASRTSSSTSAKYNAEYISAKTKEINSFKLPKQNDSEYIRIKDVEYRISHQSTYDKRHIVDIVRTSDGYSLGRDVFTNTGSYGMATTRIKSQVQKAIREEVLRLLNGLIIFNSPIYISLLVQRDSHNRLSLYLFIHILLFSIKTRIIAVTLQIIIIK